MKVDRCRSCQAEVIFIPSANVKPDGKRARLILDAKPEKRIVLGSPITTLAPNDGVVVGAQHPDATIVARVVRTYVDHHATCAFRDEWKGRHR